MNDTVENWHLNFVTEEYGEDGDEDEEDDALDELEGLRREADHREAGVEDVEEERADDDVAEAHFRTA